MLRRFEPSGRAVKHFCATSHLPGTAAPWSEAASRRLEVTQRSRFLAAISRSASACTLRANHVALFSSLPAAIAFLTSHRPLGLNDGQGERLPVAKVHASAAVRSSPFVWVCCLRRPVARVYLSPHLRTFYRGTFCCLLPFLSISHFHRRPLPSLP